MAASYEHNHEPSWPGGQASTSQKGCEPAVGYQIICTYSNLFWYVAALH